MINIEAIKYAADKSIESIIETILCIMNIPQFHSSRFTVMITYLYRFYEVDLNL